MIRDSWVVATILREKTVDSRQKTEDRRKVLGLSHWQLATDNWQLLTNQSLTPFSFPGSWPKGSGTDGPFPGTRLPFPGTDHPFLGTGLPGPGTALPFLGPDLPFLGADPPFPGTSPPFHGTDLPFLGTDLPFPGTHLPFLGTTRPFLGTDAPGPGSVTRGRKAGDRSGVQGSQGEGARGRGGEGATRRQATRDSGLVTLGFWQPAGGRSQKTEGRRQKTEGSCQLPVASNATASTGNWQRERIRRLPATLTTGNSPQSAFICVHLRLIFSPRPRGVSPLLCAILSSSSVPSVLSAVKLRLPSFPR